MSGNGKNVDEGAVKCHSIRFITTRKENQTKTICLSVCHSSAQILVRWVCLSENMLFPTCNSLPIYLSVFYSSLNYFLRCEQIFHLKALCFFAKALEKNFCIILSRSGNSVSL